MTDKEIETGYSLQNLTLNELKRIDSERFETDVVVWLLKRLGQPHLQARLRKEHSQAYRKPGITLYEFHEALDFPVHLQAKKFSNLDRTASLAVLLGKLEAVPFVALWLKQAAEKPQEFLYHGLVFNCPRLGRTGSLKTGLAVVHDLDYPLDSLDYTAIVKSIPEHERPVVVEPMDQFLRRITDR